MAGNFEQWWLKGAEVDSYIWDDITLLEDRHKKAGEIFVALYELLGEQPRFSNLYDEFSSLYGVLSDTPDDIFTQVWTDPYCYYWVRLAYELFDLTVNARPSMLATAYLASLDDDITPKQALDEHLLGIKKMVLSVCVLSNKAINFETPVNVKLPFSLPGTDRFISADTLNEISITGFDSEDIIFDDENSAQMLQCPTTITGKINIRQQYSLFNMPGVEYGPLLQPLGIEFQQRFKPMLEAAIELLAKYQPGTFFQFSQLMQVIAVKRLERTSLNNGSHSDLPGAFVVSGKQEPFDLAEDLIHEFHHNRLFFLEEYGAFLEDSEQDASYYSPWRIDARPLHGLLHAAYVFTPVCGYWLNVFDDIEQTDPNIKLMAQDQIIRNWTQVSIALYQLETYASFTDAGGVLFNSMKAKHDALHQRIQVRDIPDDPMVVALQEDGRLNPEAYQQKNGHQQTVKQSIRHSLDMSPLQSQVQKIYAMNLF